MLAKLIQPLILEIDSLQNENKFLRQRVSEFNKKTWFSVYQENLKLANEIKELNESFNFVEDERFKLFDENEKLEKENIKLKNDNNILKSISRNNQGVLKRLKNEMESNYKDEKYQKLNNDFNNAINKAKLINEKNLRLANENKLLKEVLKSVEAFTKQYSK